MHITLVTIIGYLNVGCYLPTLFLGCKPATVLANLRHKLPHGEQPDRKISSPAKGTTRGEEKTDRNWVEQHHDRSTATDRDRDLGLAAHV